MTSFPVIENAIDLTGIDGVFVLLILRERGKERSGVLRFERGIGGSDRIGRPRRRWQISRRKSE